MFQTDSKCH